MAITMVTIMVIIMVIIMGTIMAQDIMMKSNEMD